MTVAIGNNAFFHGNISTVTRFLGEQMIRIAFQTNQLSVRGTDVALYDYALFNEQLLGNESIVITKKTHSFPHDQVALDKFCEKFKVLFYDGWEDAERILSKNNIDILYSGKAGLKDEVLSSNVKTCVHAVFQFFEPHGDVYAYISEWLSKTMTNGTFPFVPYMINLPDTDEDLRVKLGIPKHATVLGRHGGHDTFSLPFVVRAVNEIVQKRKDLYFLFLNTDVVCGYFGGIRLLNHPQIIHIPAVSNLFEKVKFINTCDGMLHARFNGESFGLAIGEFSVKNKPVITFSGKNATSYFEHQHDLAHVDMLGEKGIYYDNYEDIYFILSKFKPMPEKNWDAFSEKYNKTVVMKKFKEVFIDQ